MKKKKLKKSSNRDVEEEKHSAKVTNQKQDKRHRNME